MNRALWLGICVIALVVVAIVVTVIVVLKKRQAATIEVTTTYAPVTPAADAITPTFSPTTLPVSPVPAPMVQGRYVLVSSAVVQCMNWAEVQVYAASGGANIASGVNVTKSSSYSGDMFPSSNLVDNNLTNFAHTSCNDVPWMSVDLGSVQPIYNIRLLNRTDCCQQRAVGLTVTILDGDKNVVFTSNMIADSQGNSIFSDAASNKLSFLQYDIFPPAGAIVPSRPVT